jgi:hypothetical protein
MKQFLLACLLLLFPLLAQGGAPASAKPTSSRAAAVLSDAERHARRCQSQSTQRIGRPQGTMLWGTKRDWDTEKVAEERSSVLVSVNLGPPRRADDGVTSLRLEGGHLVATSSPEAGATPRGVVGTVLQGTASDGQPVEVAICGAEPSADDPGMVFYRIEAWNAVAQEWENPCVAVGRVATPRALAVSGVWDSSGARQDVPGRFTFACETGAISKCALWGYKPWATHDGTPLVDLHQACTRMARADYCGNGRSHTRQDTTIDVYDQLGLVKRGEWNPAKASFEAAWTPDGAACLARTRDGRALESILQECPHRFQTGAAVELGRDERCTARRADVNPGSALLRNLTFGGPRG